MEKQALKKTQTIQVYHLEDQYPEELQFLQSNI